MKKKTPSSLLIRNYLKEIHATELDLALYDEFGIDTDKEDGSPDQYAIGNDPDGGWEGDAEPMPIAQVEEVITELKGLGATHIEFFQHNDHNGYHIYGVKIHKASKKERASYDLMRSGDEKKAQERRIKSLEKELKELRAVK